MVWAARTVLMWCAVSLLAALPLTARTLPAQKRSAAAATLEELSLVMIPRLAALPGVASVAPTADGRLEVKTESGRSFTVGLANLFDAVNAEPDAIEARIAEQVAAIAKVVTGASPEQQQMTAEQFAAALIPVVKPLDYLDGVEKAIAKPGEPPKKPLIAEPMLGDIVLLVGLDSTKLTQMMQSGSGEAYGMSDAQMAVRALENLKKRSVSIKVAALGALNGILFDENYTASLISVPGVWTALAKTFGGDLAVAVPERGMVMFVVASDTASVAKLRELAEMPGRPYPISSHVLRWHNSEWNVME